MTSTITDVPIYPLNNVEQRTFHRAGIEAARRFDTIIATGAAPVDTVPSGLRDFLREFADNPPRTGFAVVRGIGIDPLPDTPTSRTDPLPVGHNTAGALLLVADLLGSMTGYSDEKNGALVHEVHPVRGEETRIENTGSVNFGFHTENAHHPLRPDFLGLLCLRQDHDGMCVSRLSSVRHAVADLSPETLQLLRLPRFRSLYPTSFTRDGSGERPSSPPHPIITGNAPAYRMRFDLDNTYALDDEAKRALEELVEALDGNHRQVPFEAGDLVVIDNHIAAHGRSGFTPRYDGRDRWLRRFYSRRVTAGPGARVLPALSEIDC